jgi:hypothetical protein
LRPSVIQATRTTIKARCCSVPASWAFGSRSGRGDVLRIVALAADISVGLGIIAGLVLGFSPNRVIARWVENGTGDPLMVLVVSVVMIAVAALACFSPARRRSPS